MLEFHEKYHPLTSRPFLNSRFYTEYRPCSLLRPYIACYWKSEGEAEENLNSNVLVIPDTCMDIIIHINHRKQTSSGYLCSLQDEPFISTPREAGERERVFAVRFYFWAAHLFLHLDFKEIDNSNLELSCLGGEWEKLFTSLCELGTMEEKIDRVEKFLLKKLAEMNQNNNLFNSFDQIIMGKGRKTVKEICEYSCISQRQLQRQFLQAVGMPMKRVANMVRYQNVWKDIIISEHFDVQDAVYRYGYADQSHLLKEFKRFHGTTPEEARRIAEKNR